MDLHVGVQVICLFIIFCYMTNISVLDCPPVFKNESFSSWLCSAQKSVSTALDIFSREFDGFSISHSDFQSVVVAVNPAFLPQVELETAYSSYLTFTEPATLEKP